MGLAAILTIISHHVDLFADAASGDGAEIVGNQIILSGPVVGDEPGNIREALANTPGIDTAILRNSLGGNAPAGYQVGELFREHGLRTASPAIATHRALGCFSGAALVTSRTIMCRC